MAEVLQRLIKTISFKLLAPTIIISSGFYKTNPFITIFSVDPIRDNEANWVNNFYKLCWMRAVPGPVIRHVYRNPQSGLGWAGLGWLGCTHVLLVANVK